MPPWKGLFSGQNRNVSREQLCLSQLVVDTTPRDCAAVDFAGTTTDVTLRQQIQTRHLREFP